MLEGSLARTVQRIRDAGGEATAVAADVSTEPACLALVEQARAVYGPIDVLVNNAALSYFMPITEFPANRWMRAFAVDVHGPFMLAKEVLKDMIPRRTGPSSISAPVRRSVRGGGRMPTRRCAAAPCTAP